MQSVTGFGPRDTPPSNNPAAHRSAPVRSLLYVLGERRELEVLAQWVAYWERVRPFEEGGWSHSSIARDGRFPVESTFSLGEQGYAIRWIVDPASGVVEPDDQVARLLRAVHPLRQPGFELERTTVEPPVIDRAVEAEHAALQSCYGHERARNERFAGFVARWSIQWDGHVYDVEVESDDRLSRAFVGCVTEVLSKLVFEPFRGPPVRASTAVRFEGAL